MLLILNNKIKTDQAGLLTTRADSGNYWAITSHLPLLNFLCVSEGISQASCFSLNYYIHKCGISIFYVFPISEFQQVINFPRGVNWSVWDLLELNIKTSKLLIKERKTKHSVKTPLKRLQMVTTFSKVVNNTLNDITCEIMMKTNINTMDNKLFTIRFMRFSSTIPKNIFYETFILIPHLSFFL